VSLVLINDFHLVASNPVCRTDNLVERQFDKLKFIIDYAAENGCVILSAGDLTDSPRSWYLLPKLSDMIRAAGVRWYAVFGQHDTYNYSEKHRSATNLGVLSSSGLIEILGSNPAIVSEYALYGCSWAGSIPKPVDNNHVNVLCVHAPVSMKPLFWDHDYLDAAQFIEKHNDYKLILCGDIHRGFFYQSEDGRVIVNTGPVCRTDADEYMLRHQPCLYHIHTDPLLNLLCKKVIIPHETSEKVITRGHIEKAKHRELLLKDFINMINEGTVDDVNFLNNIRDQYKNLPGPLSDLVEHYIGNATQE